MSGGPALWRRRILQDLAFFGRASRLWDSRGAAERPAPGAPGEGRDVYERDPVGQCIQKIFGNHEVLLQVGTTGLFHYQASQISLQVSVFSSVKWAESRLPALGLLEESGKPLCGAVERVWMVSPHGEFL